MGTQQSGEVVICSIIVGPIRAMLPDVVLPWFQVVRKTIVHTFVADTSKLPIDPEYPEGYWYCAGDFCNIDEPGVYQAEPEPADIEYATCLVQPNMKDDHQLRPYAVIEGKYSVNYVCHNITNRVMYATHKQKTLADLDIPTTGYPVVVKSALGVYGQNKVEWNRRKRNCIHLSMAGLGDAKLAPDQSRTVDAFTGQDINDEITKTSTIDDDNTRKTEVAKIHLAACRGNKSKALNLTAALIDIDEEFLFTTRQLMDDYDENHCSDDDWRIFNQKMANACAVLFTKTVNTVGRKMTEAIYPGCNLDIEEKDIETPPAALGAFHQQGG